MKIYTRKGDGGQTSLFGGKRVSKADELVEAYGNVDELNSAIGLAIAHGLDRELAAMALRVQAELMSLGADLATPLDARTNGIVRMGGDPARRLESDIDRLDSELEPLRNFILPGGTPSAAALHLARTVCRRAERALTTVRESINPQALVYLNRLSDWLFTMARAENARKDTGEATWKGRG